MRKTMIGGEALIEGIMMRSPEKIAAAVRRADGGITVEKRDYVSLAKRYKLLGLPIVRGVVSFGESLILGIKALMFSAQLADIEEDIEPSKIDMFLTKLMGDRIKDVAIGFSVITAVFLGVGLFILFPNYIAGFLNLSKVSAGNTILYNLVEGAVRILIFLAYIILISKLRDIERVFQYHGAEHKAIHCYENEEELTVANVKKYPIQHPRCGTSFLLIVMLVSILVFSFLGWPGLLMRIGSRLLFVPVVAGLSYEVIRYAGRSNLRVVKLINMPGLWLQRFTTREPDETQMEVAIEALKSVVAERVGVESVG